MSKRLAVPDKLGAGLETFGDSTEMLASPSDTTPLSLTLPVTPLD